MYCPYEVIKCKGLYYIHELGVMDFSFGKPFKRLGKRVVESPFKTLEEANRVKDMLPSKSKKLF